VCNHINVVYVGADGEEQETPILHNIQVSYVPKIERDPWPEAATRSTNSDTGRVLKQGYATAPAVATDRQKHDYLLRRLLRDLESLQCQYATLTDPDVIELFQAIQRTRDKLLNALNSR
jgi:hypothetical protein